MLNTICFYFLQFILFSIIGYIAELICTSILEKRIVLSRGFLIGPYLPIYGIGSIIITTFLSKYQDDLLILFIVSAFFCTSLEYLTSLILEKLFNLRWWDYSNFKFNINGRVCLEFACLFGIGGTIIIKYLYPFTSKILNYLPPSLMYSLALIIFILFVIDLIFTTMLLLRIKINLPKFSRQDNTNAIKDEVRKSLTKYAFLISRILNNFPNIIYKDKTTFLNFEDFIFKTKTELGKLKNRVKNKIIKSNK